MKIHVIRSLALLVGGSLAAAGLTVAVSTAQADEATSVVVGSVTDRSGYPLKGIKVDLMVGDEDGGTVQKTVYTNDAGRYRGKVPANQYAHFALATDLTGNHIGRGVDFELIAGTTKVPTLKLYKGAIIRGSVTREDGTGAAKLVVGAQAPGVGFGSARVSSSGKYQMTALMPGTYSVDFVDTSGEYGAQCLDGSPRPEGGGCGTASQITVKEGQVVTLAPQVMTLPPEE